MVTAERVVTAERSIAKRNVHERIDQHNVNRAWEGVSLRVTFSSYNPKHWRIFPKSWYGGAEPEAVPTPLQQRPAADRMRFATPPPGRLRTQGRA